ncbi:MAG TPA: lasso peptide biosynthesis B2 protein [Allosphingosinicella sp.]|nr:lasso peptide biosynthesis B2 protein [Allosphingosinicella sp.]
MAHLRLPDHLGVCEVEGRVIMLDLRRDRYFELDPISASAMRRWRDGDADLEDGAGLTRLVARGTLVPAAQWEPPRWTRAKVPGQSLLRPATGPSRSALPILPEVAAGLWRVRRRLRRKGLEAAVAHVRGHRREEPTADLNPDLARFRAARLLAPVAPNCLVDSLALLAFLARRGHRADLVFGVKLDPFAAHCWLQSDEAVLTDGADSVATFTPILVV